MRRTILSIMMAASAAIAFPADVTPAVQQARADIERAMDIIDATWETSIKGDSGNLYLADSYNTFTGIASGPSDVWPYTAAIEAHCSLLEAIDLFSETDPDIFADKRELYIERLNMLIDNLEYYQGTITLPSYATQKTWKPYAVPRSNRRGGADVSGILNVYDDQMWLARELIRAYRITDNTDYLDIATHLTDYAIDGWDCWRDENGEEYGGITWGPGYNSKHACSNAPIIQPLVWLSEIYKDSDETVTYFFRNESNAVKSESRDRSAHYLDFAAKIYDWQKRKLQNPSGVYWDMMGADNTIIVKRGYRQHVDCGGATGQFFSYNTGTMISGGAELYKATDDAIYLADIEKSSQGAFQEFAKYTRKYNTYEFTTDETAQNGFNTWFNDVLMRSYVDAYPYIGNTSAKNTLNSFQTNLDYAFINHNRGNMLPIMLLNGWGTETVTKGFHQFSFASEYAMLAVWHLSQEGDNAAVGDIIATPGSPDRLTPGRTPNSVYTLTGIYLGEKEDISSHLPTGIYIVGNKKCVL